MIILDDRQVNWEGDVDHMWLTLSDHGAWLFWVYRYSWTGSRKAVGTTCRVTLLKDPGGPGFNQDCLERFFLKSGIPRNPFSLYHRQRSSGQNGVFSMDQRDPGGPPGWSLNKEKSLKSWVSSHPPYHPGRGLYLWVIYSSARIST